MRRIRDLSEALGRAAVAKSRGPLRAERQATMSRARSAAVAATVSLSMAITPLMVPPAAVADEFALRSAAPVGSSSVIPDLTPADVAAVLPAALQMWGE